MRALDRILKGRGGSQLLPLVSLIRGMFRNGEQGAWYDPSDINLNWRYNLLTYTEQFDNAAWIKQSASITPNSILAPNGTLTADQHTSTGTNSNIYQVPGAFSSGVNYTLSRYVKAGSKSFCTVGLHGLSDAYFDLTNLTYSFSGTGAVSASIEDVGDGWRKVSATFVWGSGTTYRAYFAIASSLSSQVVSVDDYIYLWGGQLQTGSVATTYQQIVTPEISYLTYQPQPVLYQDAAGTTPVTAVEQPVGLMLDKSKGLVLGSELVTNGTGSSLTGWTAVGTSTWTIESNRFKATVTGTPSTSGGQRQDITVVAGKSYKVSADVDITAIGTGRAQLIVYDGAAFTPEILNVQKTAVGSYAISGYVRPTGTTIRVYLIVAADSSTTTTAYFDNISVKLADGNHAFQSTSASRPVLSARVNLLTKTEALTDAAWQKINGGTGIAPVVTGGFTAPDGTSTAFRVQISIAAGTSGSDYSIVRQVLSGLVNTTYTNQLWVKSNTGSNQSFLLYVNNGQPLVTATSSWAQVSSSYSLGTSYFDIGTLGSTASTKVIDILVWHPDARVSNDGVGIPAYQRVNTSTDYDTAGFPLYLKTDGVDDWMQTNSINFTSTDKMTVWAGFRNLSAATYGGLVGLGATVSVAGSMLIWNRVTSGYLEFYAEGASTPQVLITETGTVSIPRTGVVTFAADLSQTGSAGAGLSARLNAATLATTPTGTPPGTGFFANAALTLFRYNSSNYLNGRFFGLIVRGAQSTASQIASGEKYINSKTKAY